MFPLGPLPSMFNISYSITSKDLWLVQAGAFSSYSLTWALGIVFFVSLRLVTMKTFKAKVCTFFAILYPEDSYTHISLGSPHLSSLRDSN